MLSKLRQKDNEGKNKQGPKMVSFGASKLEGRSLPRKSRLPLDPHLPHVNNGMFTSALD